MTTVLVTGSAGQIGGAAADALEALGFDVRRFDLSFGQDLRDDQVVADAVAGCALVVHAGAIPHDRLGSPTEIVSTNVLGTWHVLAAAERVGVERVVYLSSAQVFGCAEGEGVPAYLPIDDAHPLRAARPYGMSKRLAESMCEAWTKRTGIPTIALRPVLVLSEARLATFSRRDAEFDAFVHLDDVTDAIVRAVTTPVRGHLAVTLCGPGAFDVTLAAQTIGWRPGRDWPATS